MNETAIIVAAIAGSGALAAALITFLATRRQSSGRIETSDAATLWKASETIRKEMREELVSMRDQVATMKTQVADLLEQIGRLERRLAEYERLGRG